MLADFSMLFAIGAVVVGVLFTFTWLLSLKLNNFSFVDITWSYGLLFLAPLYALAGSGFGQRKLLAAIIATVWSFRLGTYLLLRIRRHHPHEDVRYTVLREKWKDSLAKSFFWFFQAQALLILLLSVPILLACLNPVPRLTTLEVIGALVWLVGILGEAISDAQMNAFKRDPTSKGKVCQVGLWRYSRHPNYFFESVVWLGFWLFACGSPWGWVTVYAPALILYFLLRVTGIPLTEECAVKSKGDSYREYQRTTSSFIPLPPKRS
jgi:steroid 5-alpha reductase family enzyme